MPPSISNRSANPGTAHPSGRRRARAADHHAPHRLRRLVDGVSCHELSALYSAFLPGRSRPLPALAIQYADYAVWQRQWIEGEILQQQAATGRPPWPVLRPCWSCRPTIRVRRSRTMPALRGLVLDEQLTAGLKD